MVKPRLNRRELSARLSLAANARVCDSLTAAYVDSDDSYRIGITGPPGAGKSTLIGRLASTRLLRSDGDLALVVIDPTSAVSGGAVLGDRIRMEAVAGDPRVFIRSLASRSNLDGLAENLSDVLLVFESDGFKEIIVETVGVGQVEYAVRNLVDTMVLVLMPGVGDQVQAMKGGILEKADIYAIHKADLPGTTQLIAALNSVLKQKAPVAGSWAPMIVPTSVDNDESVDQLNAAIEKHRMWTKSSRTMSMVRARRRAYHVGSLVARRVSEVLDELSPEALTLPPAALYEMVILRLRANLPK